MKKTKLFALLILMASITFAQTKYSTTPDIQPEYKDKFTFSAKLDEKTNVLSFETNAPVSVVTLETYTPAELAVRKGKQYLNTYVKKGQVYSYNLKNPLLKNKYAYWLKVSWGENGAPLGEYFFRLRKTETPTVNTTPIPVEKNEELVAAESNDDATHPVIKTNIKCEAGKIKITTALKKMDGVFDVKIDVKTGTLKLHYSSDGTPLNDIIDVILNNGFDVLDDGEHTGIKKSTKPSANPCKTKPVK